MVARTSDRSLLNYTGEFEPLYTALRSIEGRIYSDAQVGKLPEISEGHLYREEWAIRKVSCKKLTNYLKKKKRSLKILEVGCGNGWLSHQLSKVQSSYVVGLDINLLELRQAERVFVAVPNLAFVYGDIDSAFLGSQKFDIVVLAATVQYFDHLPEIIRKVMERLNDGGEIHLVDSHFYNAPEAEKARRRSAQYFEERGFERMKEFYFHHSFEELNHFRYTILYNPDSLVTRIMRNRNPFHWICIK